MSAIVTPTGLEPVTYCLEGSCSIQLSYGAKFIGINFTADTDSSKSFFHLNLSYTHHIV